MTTAALGSPEPPPEGLPSACWPQRFARRASRGGDELTAILSLAASTDVITFSGGFPAPETFPVEVMHSLTEQLLNDDASVALQYSPTEGLPEARSAVSRMIVSGQGRHPDHVLITSGGIEALQLLTRTFVDADDLVLVEAPTYLGAIMAFAGFEAKLAGIGIDEGGLRVEELEALLASGRTPKLLYVIPDHQNPTGLSLAADRRQQLVDVCRQYGVLLVEDVAYRDLSFDGQVAPSLWSLGPDVVVQIGTFSKVFMPGVRLGWAVGPHSIIAAMTAAKQNSDQCSGALGQLLMARYVENGHLARNLVRARAIYRERCQAMLDALAEHMPDGVSWTRPRGGFFVWLTAAEDVDTGDLTAPAARLGVAYVPGTPFHPDGQGANTMRLAFSRATPTEIAEGVSRLGTLLRTGSGQT